ncbi:MAG: dTDP-4-dehydrorhamnose reductase [Desulfobacterales bacterium CG07_land_8_20_14_0_80_52_14]|nr:MAG: dTDP-4-dehydrorhamnose reductase [Desulfobacterales bacterium CG23_combo_of_CG06-09_8_20_14_all_52_9]PIU49386.1 MAG: dTDP-4-dehydrorhamnose reductase [Desulfobacterales bacterium CG07_land_8_20_14_0_80_52_14]
MTIAIIGSNGQLGHELADSARLCCMDAAAADLPEVDITDAFSAEKFLKSIRPSVVINAAAYTNVDQAESDVKTAFAVNSQGPEILARICKGLNAPLIHISTDYVFDGKAKVPYRESDPVNPLGVYGRSKEEGERKVRLIFNSHVIIRTAWLYSPFGNNFVKTMLRLGKEKEELRVVADQYGSPTCAADLAKATLEIIRLIHKEKALKWGTYHFSGHGVTTWHRFAETVFESAGKYTLLKVARLHPIPTEEYPTPAIRPKYSVLDCSLIRRHWGIVPRPWQESLKETIDRIFKNDAQTFGH